MTYHKFLLSASVSAFLLSAMAHDAKALTWDDFKAGASRVWNVLSECYQAAPAIRQTIVAAVGVASKAGFIDSDAAQGLAKLSHQADQIRIQISAMGAAISDKDRTADEALAGTSK